MKPRYTGLADLVRKRRVEATKQKTTTPPATTGTQKGADQCHFQISDYALSDTQGRFTPREAGERHGQIIERLKAEVTGLQIPAAMRPGAVIFLVDKWKARGAWFYCQDTDMAAEGLCDGVRNLLATGHNDRDAEGGDWKSQYLLATMLVQECFEIPRALPNLSEELRAACEYESVHRLWSALVPLLLWEFGRHRYCLGAINRRCRQPLSGVFTWEGMPRHRATRKGAENG